MKKPIVINIQSLIDKVVVNGSSKEDVENLEKVVTEAIIRALNAANVINVDTDIKLTCQATIELKDFFEAKINKDNLDLCMLALHEIIKAHPDVVIVGKIVAYDFKKA